MEGVNTLYRFGKFATEQCQLLNSRLLDLSLNSDNDTNIKQLPQTMSSYTDKARLRGSVSLLLWPLWLLLSVSAFQSVNSNVPNPQSDCYILHFAKVLTRTSASIDEVEHVGRMNESSKRVERNTNRTRQTGTYNIVPTMSCLYVVRYESLV